MKSLSYLNKYLIKYKWRLLLGIIFIYGSNWFKVEMPNYFGNLINEISTWNDANIPDDLLLFSLKAGGYFLLLSLFSAFFLFTMRQTIIIMSRLIEFDLKNEIYNHYQKLSFSFYKKNNTGDIINRISEDVSKVRMYLGPGLMYSFNLVILSILIIRNMLHESTILTLFVLIPLPIMSLIIYKVSSKISTISTVVQEEQSHMSTLAQETFTGIRVIKAYERTREMEDRFNASTENYKKKSMKLVLINSLFMPTIFVLIGVSTIVSIYLGGLLFYNDDIDIGVIFKFIFYVNILTWPFASIGFVTAMIQRAAASQKRINEFLNEEPEIVNHNTSPFSFQNEIEFRNVSYTYKNTGIKAINNLSFTLKKGESIGIIGKTGSGKSTILNLIMRQFDPDEGDILIDGISIKEINLDDFRNQSGIVPQDNFLFSATIRENILFGCMDHSISEERLVEVTKMAHLYHNIMNFPDKFDTMLGERGINLSGGQKQRLSIARALVRHPKLLLLDDCLSAVDTETEDFILNNLAKLKTTSIIVSHRVSSIRNANKIINIHNGSIIEEGTHKELLDNDGVYAALYKKQLTEN